MKYLFLFVFLLTWTVAYAQEPPQPTWVEKRPSSRGYRFIFVPGTGRGATPEEARKKAFGVAYVQGLQENGMTTGNQQSLDDIESKGVDAFIEGSNGLAVRIHCEERIRLPEGNFIAYVLLLVARSAAQNPMFDDADDADVCNKAEFSKRRQEYRAQSAKLAEEERIQNARRAEEAARQEEAKRKKQASFWKYHHNNYFSFTLGNGISYGKLGGLAFSGRHGGNLGVGYHVAAGLGVEYTDIEADYGNGLPFGYIHWSVGAKFYFWRYFYLGANYGIAGVERIPALSGEAFRSESYKVKYVPSAMAGVDFCARRFIIGVGAGAAMEQSGSMLPAWNFGLGFTF